MCTVRREDIKVFEADGTLFDPVDFLDVFITGKRWDLNLVNEFDRSRVILRWKNKIDLILIQYKA